MRPGLISHQINVLVSKNAINYFYNTCTLLYTAGNKIPTNHGMFMKYLSSCHRVALDVLFSDDNHTTIGSFVGVVIICLAAVALIGGSIYLCYRYFWKSKLNKWFTTISCLYLFH